MNTTPATTTELVSNPPLWRLQLVRVLQIIGILLGFIGGADWVQLIAFLPTETAAWLALSGPAFAASAKPAIMFVGDWMDDGKPNGSFKITPLVIAFLCLGCLLFVGCVPGVRVVTPWGTGEGSKGGFIYTPPAQPVTIPIFRTK